MGEHSKTPLSTYPKMIQAEDISLEDFSPWGTSAAVVWPPSKADHYAIRWWSTGGEVKDYKTEAPVYIIHDLMPGSTYRMQVAALNEEGKGEYSKERQIRTAPAPVHSVQLCNSPKAPETSLIVRFEDDDASPKTYRVVIRSLSAGEEIPKETLTAFAYMEGLVPGEEYEAFVHVIKDGLQSKPCFTENSRKTLPAKVGKLNVTGATPGSQNISWPPVFGAESYIFEWRRSDRNYSQTPTKQTEHTLEHLESGQAYVARVVAINSAGQGEYSKPVEFMTDLVSPRNVEAKVRYSGEDILVDVKFVKSPHKVKHYNIGEVSEHVQPIQTPTCSGTLSGFDHGKKYNIFVEAEAENGAKSDRMFANTILTKPGQVRLQSEAISKSCEKIFWDHAFGATSYIVKGASDEDLPVHGTEISLKDLPPDQTFSVSVSAVNDSGSGDFSEPLIFRTASGQPNDIRVANRAGKSQEEVTVSCLPPHEPSDYKLKVSIVEVSTNVIADWKEVEEWHATFQNLEPGTQFYAKLQFLHKTIATRNSDEATSEPFWTCCSKIVGLKATFIAHDKYLIEWKKVAGATKYFIRYRPENGGFADFYDQSAECTLNNLILGQKYTVIVAAVNGASDREQSETVTFHTGWGVPSKVEVHRNEQNPDTSIDVRFTEPKSIPHVYLVTVTATSLQHRETVRTKENFTTIAGLHPGTEYAVHIQSMDEKDAKLSSGKSEIVTRFTCPDKVNDLGLTIESARSRNASWEPVVGATLYQIKLRKTGSRPQLIDIDGKKSEHVIENLCLNTSYKISITAINTSGSGKESNEQSFRTALFPPSRLVAVLSESKSASEVDLTFEFPKPPAANYRIRVENLHGGTDVFHFTEKNFMKISDLNPGGKYKFYACSVNENDKNLDSEEIESSEISMCQVKFDIGIDEISNTEKKVRWDDVPGTNQYEVAWRIQNEVEWQTELTDQNAFILRNLVLGKHYEVKASPITMGRKGEESEVKKFTTVPGRPVNLTSKMISPLEVLLTCKSRPGATRYEFTVTSETFDENSKPCTQMTQSPQFRFHCTGTDTKFQTYVRAINSGGISGSSNVLKFRQVLRHLQLKFLSQAKNHLPQEKFIMPELATLPDQKISNDFKACIKPGEGETVLMAGGLFCGKTACCSYFLQTQDLKQLCLLLDYDSIKSVERDFTAETDIKSLLWKYMPDITSEEMDFVYQWMKEHSQHVTLVVDNFALPDDFQVKHIQHEDKETPQVLFYNLLKTNRDTFPKSHIFCTTSQISVSSWLKPTASYRMHGFDDDGVKEMRLQVLEPRKPTGNIDIPSQLEYFSRHPGSCEIILRLMQQNGSTSDETDCTSLASVLIEILSQNIARHSEQDKAIKLKQLYEEIMKVPQKIYNTKIDPQKINKVKGKPRKYAPVEPNDDCSSYSNVSSVLETPRRRNAMNSLLPSCDILDDICLKALYFGVFATADEFKKHFSKRRLKFSSTSYVWIMTAGMLRQHTSKKAAKLFQPVTKIEMKECEKKAEQFKTFVKKNLKDILTSVYTDSQITLDWFACCAELDDEKLLETCTLEIKVKDDMSTAAVEEVTKFLESVPKQFCRQVKIRVKEGTGTVKTVPIHAAIKRNPNGSLFNNVNYKRSSIASLSRKGSQRSNLSRNDSRNQADMTLQTMPIPEEGILNSEDTIGAQVRSPSGTVHEEVFEPEEMLVVKPEKGEDGGENSDNVS